MADIQDAIIGIGSGVLFASAGLVLCAEYRRYIRHRNDWRKADDALVELVAREMYAAVMADEDAEDYGEPRAWVQSIPRVQEHYRRLARAVLATLRDASMDPPKAGLVRRQP